MPQHPTYRSAGNAQSAGYALIMIAGLALAFGGQWHFRRAGRPGAALGATAGAIAATFVLLLLQSTVADRRRFRRVRARLAAEGFDLQADQLPFDQRRQAVEKFRSFADLRGDPNDLRWIATKPTPAGEVVVLRTQYVLRPARSSYTVTAISVAVPIAYNGPTIWVHRATIGLNLNGWKDLTVGDETFDRHYAIRSRSEEAVRRLLTPEVRDLITSGPKREWWNLGAGFVVCNHSGEVDAAGIATMLDRANLMAGLLATTA